MLKIDRLVITKPKIFSPIKKLLCQKLTFLDSYYSIFQNIWIQLFTSLIAPKNHSMSYFYFVICTRVREYHFTFIKSLIKIC